MIPPELRSHQPPLSRRIFGRAVAVLVFALNSAGLIAEVSAQQVPTAPSSTHIFPAGGRRGATVDVLVGAECIPPGTRFRMFGDGLQVPAELGERVAAHDEPSPRRKPSEQPVSHPTEWKSQVVIADDAPIGPALWRLSCASGGSGGRPFIVGELPEYIERESNSTAEVAEAVEMPVTINGRIAGECDLDYFRFRAHAGDLVCAEMLAARLGSGLDPLLQVRHADGRRVIAQELRVGADPVVVFRADSADEYLLLISGVTHQGGPSHVYRATVTATPFARFAFPAGGQISTTQAVSLFSPDGEGQWHATVRNVAFPSVPGPFWYRALEGANPVMLMAGESSEYVEGPDNDRRESASDHKFPCVVDAQLESAADEDWYRLTGQAGKPVCVECSTPPGASAALPIVSIVDSSGGVAALGSAVRVAGGVVRLNWTPPADGPWWLRVRDLQQGVRGGPDFVYRLSVREAAPDFRLSAKSDAINLVQGARTEVDVTVERIGELTSAIELRAEGLPEGVTLENPWIAAGQSAGKLAFAATNDAPSGDMSIRIKGRADVAGTMIERSVFATHLGHDADGIGVGSIDADHLQLTVVHRPVFRLYCNEAYQYAHRGTLYPYLMEVERLNGFDQPIHLEVADRQIKDLDGIEIPEITIPQAQSQLMMPLYLPETMHINVQAHSNVYAQGHVEFTDKHGRKQSMLVVSTMRCMIRTLPPVVKLHCEARELTPGADGAVACPVRLSRTPNFVGAMDVCLVDPPTGITADPVTISANAEAGDLVIRIAETARRPFPIPLRVRAVGRMEEDVQVISEDTLMIGNVRGDAAYGKVDQSIVKDSFRQLAHDIAIANREALTADKLIGERIPLGEADDYKPCLAKLPSGELMLTAFHQHKREGDKVMEQTLLFRSPDGGRTWTGPQPLELLGREPYLTVLKDGTIFITGHLLQQDVRNEWGYTTGFLHRSADGGRTWQSTRIESERIKPKASNHTTRNVLQLADGSLLLGVDYDGGGGPYYVWRSTDGGATWDKTQRCEPRDFQSVYGFFGGETWLWQARSGKVWALVRVDSNELPIKDRPIKAGNDQADHFILFSSTDGGKTFDRIRDIGDYGEMYMSLLRLKNQRLLLTFTVRDLNPPLGVRALLGSETDDGFEFDFTRDRIMLDTRTPVDKHQGGGFGPTVQLDDGMLVTSYSYRGEDDKTHLEVIRWKAPTGER